MPTFEFRSTMPVSAAELFAYHDRAGAFERLVPPWEKLRVVERAGGIRDGGTLTCEIKIGPLRKKCVAVHHDYVAGQQFADTLISGPFAKWDHTHRCIVESESSSKLIDHIEYKLPGGAVGAALGDGYLRKQLARMFQFRHKRTHDDLLRHHKFAHHPRMCIAVTGASGVVGRHLIPFLTTAGHAINSMVRGSANVESDIAWDPATGNLETEKLQGVNAIVHLAGKNITVRWNKKNQKEMWDSRIVATEMFCRTLAAMKNAPRILVCASGVGYYGDRGDELLTENSHAGSGFTAEICKAWEAATEPARQVGIRVVNLRIGPALSLKGGMLAELLTPAKLGLTGRVGTGRQYIPWIALDDLIGIIHHVLMTPTISGPLNAVAPTPVRQIDFIRTLGRILHRPTILPMPAAAIRLLFGQMGRELLLASTRVSPAALIATNFEFQHADLEDALRFELGQMLAM